MLGNLFQFRRNFVVYSNNLYLYPWNLWICSNYYLIWRQLKTSFWSKLVNIIWLIQNKFINWNEKHIFWSSSGYFRDEIYHFRMKFNNFINIDQIYSILYFQTSTDNRLQFNNSSKWTITRIGFYCEISPWLWTVILNWYTLRDIDHHIHL